MKKRGLIPGSSKETLSLLYELDHETKEDAMVKKNHRHDDGTVKQPCHYSKADLRVHREGKNLQSLSTTEHRMKGQSGMDEQLNGGSTDRDGYGAKRMYKAKIAQLYKESKSGNKCIFTGEDVSCLSTDLHHLTKQENLKERDGDTDYSFPTAKKKHISSLVNQGPVEEVIDELWKTAPVATSAHKVFHFLDKNEKLQDILGLKNPIEIKDGHMIVQRSWRNELPSVLETGVTHEIRLERFRAFLKKTGVRPTEVNELVAMADAQGRSSSASSK